MPAQITMPQLSDTMTEGTIVKWLKEEGQPVKAGEIVAEVETDKATMEMESFESGTIASIVAKAGDKVPVGGVIAIIAKTGEKIEDVKKSAPPSTPTSTTSTPPGAVASPTPSTTTTPDKKPTRIPPSAQTPNPRPHASTPTVSGLTPKASYQFDLIVLGGGPAGYAAAIRAGQLKKRVLCIEKENLGGTCLNWGCIPTKALLEGAALIRKVRDHAADWGISYDNLKVDFGKSISRSRDIAGKLNKGIGHLFGKYQVKHELGIGQVTAPHRVKYKTKVDGKEVEKEVTAEHILVAVGCHSRDLPTVKFDGKKIISSREAMTLKTQPKSIAIIGAGAIGCEFADFYSSMGSQVTIIEMMDHMLPIEDEDVSILLERSFAKRGIKILTKTKTDSVDTNGDGVTLNVTTPKGPEVVTAEVCLLAVGVTGNIDGLFGPGAPVEIVKGHVNVDRKTYKTNVDSVYAAGDIIGPPWLAHVAHHEAVYCVERIFGVSDHTIDYSMIPGCTYIHPQVASIGLTERKAREAGKNIKIGKFPFAASGRAMASGDTEGFVKLIFDAKYGNLIGAHMVGENVTELLSELVLAHKLEATEDTLIETMHPHPTLSEALMEAAGVADARAIHL